MDAQLLPRVATPKVVKDDALNAEFSHEDLAIDIVLPPWGDDGELPEWAVDPDVIMAMKMFEAARRNNPTMKPRMALTCTAGPAVILGGIGAVIYTVMAYALVGLAALSSKCTKQWPQTNMKLLYGLALVPVVSLLVLEQRMMRYIIACQLASVRRFDFLGFPFYQYPYLLWASFMSFRTFLHYANVASSAAVVGKIFAATSCDQEGAVENVWDVVMSQSIWAIFPHRFFSLPALAMTFFSLPFLRVLVVAAQVVPVQEGVTYACGFGKKYVFFYPTLTSQEMNHGLATMQLSMFCFMEAPTAQDTSFTKAVMDDWKAGRQPTWEMRFLTQLNARLARYSAHVLFAGLFQAIGLLEVEVTMTALGRVAYGVNDWQMIVSVSIGFLVGGLAFSDMIKMALLVSEAMSELQEMNLDEYDENYVQKASAEMNKTYRAVGLALIVTILFLMGYIHAVVKFVAIWACDDHMINLITGCVDFD